MFKFNIKRLTYPRFLALGFLTVILLGTFLLCLPVSSASGQSTDLLSALFTATSATCVTGLAVFDTGIYWSRFGQIVILSLIQIGGLSFMSIFAMFSIFTKKKISLSERKVIMQVSGNMRYHGVVALLKKMVFGTIFIEIFGAVLLAIRFCEEMPPAEGLFYAVFHSVSAFCNAGFDLMAAIHPEASLVAYQSDVFVNVVVMCLIVVGGIGFLVWDDFYEHHFHFKKFCLHSKLAIVFTATLIVCGFLFFLISEWNHAFSGMPFNEKVLNAMFQSITSRTAGFNTVPQGDLSETGKFFTYILMFIGGSPASTAGGVKTTTAFIVILSALASAKNVKSVTTFKKRIEDHTVRQATSIVTIYLCAVMASCMLIAFVEPLPIVDIMFEVVSAVGTVGLSVGITSSLSVFSKILLIFLMFFGRIGGLSLVLVLAEKKNPTLTERPVEKILIG